MRSAASRCSIVACLCGLVACTTPAASDASIDAAEAGVAADATPDAPTAAIVACQSAVDSAIASCHTTARPSWRRLCTLRAYRDACVIGRADVVAAIATCLAIDPCANARDPGAAASCVATVVAAQTDAVHASLDQAWCACSPSEVGCPSLPSLTGAELVMIDGADAARTTACLTAGCGMPTFCFGSSSLGAALLQCDMVTP